MANLVVPYHLDEHLDGFDIGIPVDMEVRVDLPGSCTRTSTWTSATPRMYPICPTRPLVVRAWLKCPRLLGRVTWHLQRPMSGSG